MKNFFNKYGGVFLIFAAFEQMIGASSTFFMIKLGSNLIQGHSLVWFWAFVISLILVFIPRIFKQKYMIKAEYTTFDAFISRYEKNLYNYPFLKTNNEFCKEKQAFFHNQTWQIIEEAYYFAEDFITTILNVAFNIIIIVVSLNNKFFIAYLCSAVFILAGVLLTKKVIARKSTDAQLKQSNVQSTLFDGWDTLLIGNQYNWSKWRESFKEKKINAEKAGISYSVFNNFVSFLVMIGSIIPIIAVTFEIILKNTNNINMLTATLLILPRQVNNIQYLSIIIEYLTEMFGIKEKINNIEMASKKIDCPEKYYGKINWADLSFSFHNQYQKFNCLEEFLRFLDENIKNHISGRLVIKGKNGSGKTTLLMLIKQHYGNDAYLFPNHTRLFFKANDDKEYSTGQKIRVNIEELLENNIQKQVKIFLFDEWNANLDMQNQKEISKYIEHLASDKLILEVRNKEIEV